MVRKLGSEGREAVLLPIRSQLSQEALAPALSDGQPSFYRLFCTVEPAPLQPGLLMDACKYLESLQYRVWKKMLGSVESGKDMQQNAPCQWRLSCAAETWLSFSAGLPAALPDRPRPLGLPALPHLREANILSVSITNIYDGRPNSRFLPQGHSDSLLPVCPSFIPRSGSGPGKHYFLFLGILGVCGPSYFLVSACVSLPWLLQIGLNDQKPVPTVLEVKTSLLRNV